MLGITVLINLAQIARYIDLERQGLNWWSAIYLRDIIIYFVIFVQMLVEYLLWPNKIYKWRQDLVFEQRFSSANEDVSENYIRKNIQSIVEQIAEEGEENDEKLNHKIE